MLPVMIMTIKPVLFAFQSNMTLAAVALQDHMSRSLSLQDPFKKKKLNHRLPVAKGTNERVQQNLRKTGKPSKNESGKQEYNLDPKPAPLSLGLFCLNCFFLDLYSEPSRAHDFDCVYYLSTEVMLKLSQNVRGHLLQ